MNKKHWWEEIIEAVKESIAFRAKLNPRRVLDKVAIKVVSLQICRLLKVLECVDDIPFARRAKVYDQLDQLIQLDEKAGSDSTVQIVLAGLKIQYMQYQVKEKKEE